MFRVCMGCINTCALHFGPPFPNVMGSIRNENLGNSPGNLGNSLINFAFMETAIIVLPLVNIFKLVGLVKPEIYRTMFTRPAISSEGASIVHTRI